MISFMGKKVSKNERILVGLSKLFGMNRKLALLVCNSAGFGIQLTFGDLSHLNRALLASIVERLSIVEEDKWSSVKDDLHHLHELKTYKSQRHRLGLPVRGQRTHTNARTRKGPAKSIAGKKK